jgi:ParB-like chromosome segregation protein Spo0J
MTSSAAIAGALTADPSTPVELAEVVQLPLASLQVGPTLRVDGILEARVQTLMESPEDWEPIVVANADWTVIDGCHRALAARRLGLREVAAVQFEGSASEEFLEFVRRNIGYSDGFSHRERRNAAWRILSCYPEWSDRRVGDLCGISTKTVADLRGRLTRLLGPRDDAGGDFRIGRDGRRRPVDARARRAEIADALRENPDASLRDIARLIGVSPETVRSVRARLSELELAEDVSFPEGFGPGGPWTSDGDWRPDVAFTSRDDGVVVADFFERTKVGAQDFDHTASIPLSRIYEVADEARRRAAFWTAFADRVEGRAR